MFAASPGSIRISALALAAALFVSFTSRGSAEERTDSTNAVKVTGSLQPTEQSLPSKFLRPYRPGENILESDIFKKQGSTDLPRQAPPPPSTKKNDELLDRQKNWIFISRDEKKSDSAKEAIGVDEISPEARKSVITQFLENRSAANSKTNFGSRNEINSSLSPQPLTSDLKSGFAGEKPNDVRRSGSLQPQPLDRDLSGTDAQKAKFADLWRERFGINQSQAREEKEADSKAFLNLFNSRSSVPVAGGIIAVSGPNKFGVQPLSPGDPGAALSTDANAFTSSLDPFKEAPRRPVGGSSILTEPSFTSRAFGPGPAAVLKQEAPKSVSQPAVLPFPKRHF
ncbi:MAG: hypothetical protein ABIQ35_11965 [Verrucomicrobiota bacterium]